jgi:hypothetical protein
VLVCDVCISFLRRPLADGGFVMCSARTASPLCTLLVVRGVRFRTDGFSVVLFVLFAVGVVLSTGIVLVLSHMMPSTWSVRVCDCRMVPLAPLLVVVCPYTPGDRVRGVVVVWVCMSAVVAAPTVPVYAVLGLHVH